MVKSYIKAIILILVLFFAITFGIKNYHAVQMSYYFNLFDVSAPLWLIVYGSLILGLIIGWLLSFAGRLGIKRKLKAQEKENKEIKAELELMRSKAAVPVYNENIYVATPQSADETADGDDPKKQDFSHFSY